MFLVSGITGQVGGAAARQLLGEGHTVRALARDPGKAAAWSQRSGIGLITSTHLLEEALGDLPFPTAFLRAGSFLENYTGALVGAASTGWLGSSCTDKRGVCR